MVFLILWQVALPVGHLVATWNTLRTASHSVARGNQSSPTHHAVQTISEQPFEVTPADITRQVSVCVVSALE